MLAKKCQFLRLAINHTDRNIFRSLNKIQTIVLQWLFIKHRCYPWSYDKKIEMQLSEILKLDKALIEKILCIDGQNIFDIAETFLKEIMMLVK